MNIIVTGTTGTVGSEVVRQAVADDNIKNIISLARKECGKNHPKVRNVIHTDFHTYTGWKVNSGKAVHACGALESHNRL